MTTLAEILTVAQRATNETYAHYFVNLASGDNKKIELQGVVNFLRQTQPWLFFTEGSVEEMFKFMNSDTLYMNMFYTLTAIWRQRLALDQNDYKTYIEHLSVSFDIHAAQDPGLSVMQEEYRLRLNNKDTISALLSNNMFIVFMVSTVLYIDTNLLVAIDGKK